MDAESEAVLKAERPWAAVQADCLDLMRSLPDDCVHLVVTSPPYEQARLYLEDGQDMGIARDTEAWVAWMREVCREARRVCAGLCVFVVEGQTRNYRYSCSPFLLMADLHREGFHLRKPPIYKRVGIPGSGGPDWLRNDFEPIVCFSKGGKLPWSDNTACGHPPKWEPGGDMSYRNANGERKNAVAKMGSAECRKGSRIRKIMSRQRPGEKQDTNKIYSPPDLANPGNVIECLAGGRHFGSSLAYENEAPFPENLARFFVKSFAPPGGVVFDPFCGSGTTLAVAIQEGRRAVGCDIRKSQVELTKRRCVGAQPPLFVQ